MPSDFTCPNPVFYCADPAASADYYVQKLGFQLDWKANDEFFSVSRGRCAIFLCNDKQSQPRMWIWVGLKDVDVRTLHQQYIASGARVRNPPTNYPWALEMQVEDLDGNVLRIGSDSLEDEPFGYFLNSAGERHGPIGG